MPIEIDFTQTRDGLSTYALEQIDSQDSEKNAADPAAKGEKNAFDQDLAKQTPSPRPKSNANSHFTLSCGSARQHHRGQIGARDQEHQKNGGQQNQQQRFHWPKHDFIKRKGGDPEAVILRIIVRIIPTHRCRNGIELGLRLFCGSPLSKTRDDSVAARVTNFQFLRGESQRLPDIGSFAKLRTLNSKKWNRKFETRRHHADDGEAATVCDNLTADNLRIAIESTLPQSFTDDKDVVVSRRAIGRLERAPANRRHPENIEKIRRTDRTENAFGT